MDISVGDNGQDMSSMRHGGFSMPPQSINMRGMTITDYILEVNRQSSHMFLQQESWRLRHQARHPTQVGATKCADGRLHFAYATSTATGIVKPFRAVGGRFRGYWPAFTKRLIGWNQSAVERGARSLLFVTYHFSQSQKHLGCLGWQCDTDAARAHAQMLSKELKTLFGEQMTVILTGFETDRDNLILHGKENDISGDMLIGMPEDDVRTQLALAFPKVDLQTRKDIVPFLMGNAAHVEQLTLQPRDLTQLGHHERILAIGQCYDWIAQKNQALIINDVDPNLDDAIIKMAGIIEENFDHAPPEDTFCIFTNIPYKLSGQEQRQAEMRALGLQQFAQEHIRAKKPNLWNSGRLCFLSGVTFEHSRKLKVLEQGRINPD